MTRKVRSGSSCAARATTRRCASAARRKPGRRTCTATSATPVVTIAEPRASLGSTLHVTGAGFCHPGEKRGGSTIAIKIDEGKNNGAVKIRIRSLLAAVRKDENRGLCPHPPEGKPSGHPKAEYSALRFSHSKEGTA